MTQLELARKGITSIQMTLVAKQEGVEAEFVRQGVAGGTIVIPANTKHTGLVPCGIGQRLTTKVNANIGTSSDFGNLDTELEKLKVALLELAREFDVTLSLGDGMRPGCLADATDRAQVEELITIGELVPRAQQAGVQVMVEGPGHLPLNQIEANVRLEKSICKGAPFYVLGPLVTDVAAGYDHITGAIGGAVAAAAGTDFLCYVTPSEHLSLPDAEDVRQGVIASRIAAHAGDIVKGVKDAEEWDRKMSVARKKLDWKEQARLSLDPDRSRQVHGKRASAGAACSMCGEFCAMELMEKYLDISAPKGF